MSTAIKKPLGRKAYGSIPHLPNSRLGPGDWFVTPGQARICCEKARDDKDVIIAQEKVDGSCVAVAKIGGELVPLQRKGYPAISSPYPQHHLFHDWVMSDGVRKRFDRLLDDGERLCGEWLAQAHGTRYDLPHEPFVAFDIMRGPERATMGEMSNRTFGMFVVPALIGYGKPMSVGLALSVAQEWNKHGAIDPIEGVVYRVERNGKVDFLAKYVRPDKIDGCYLPEVSGRTVWNWQPPDS